MPFGPYESFADCVAKNQDKENPEAYCGFIQSQVEGANSSLNGMSGHSCMLKGSTITADFGQDQLFEKNGKRFAKIFLISGQANLKNWAVTADSLPRRLETFRGRPFISEPGLAHFGADNMPVHEIISKQEQYRAGTIRDIVQSANGDAYAIVEFADNALGNKVWNDMKKGEAIYSSPAVAGFSQMINGVRTFMDWFGLHLARVSSPAYGVFHASLKQTCEGPEKLCMDKLIASASMILDNSSQLSADANQGKMDTTSQAVQTAMTDEEKKKKMMEEEMASLKTQLASLSAKVAAMPGMEGQTTPVTDAVPPNEKQAGQGAHDRVVQYQSASANDKIKNLETRVAHYEAKEKTNLINKIIDMKMGANLLTASTADAEKQTLGNLTIEQLESKVADFEPIFEKMMEMQSQSAGLPQSEGRIVRMPTAGTASTEGAKPANLNQLRGKWY